MKISQKQAQLLAREVVNKLKDSKVYKVPDLLKEQLKSFIKKRDELQDVVKAAEEAVQKHDSTLLKIAGREMYRRIEAYYKLDKMIEKIEERNIPSLQQVEDEIILKAMFANEDDMQKFIDSIVSKHAKKLQSKILAN